MNKKLTFSCPGNNYEFIFDCVNRRTDGVMTWKRDWYRFSSSRFTVCCEDASEGERGPKHVLHVYPRPGRYLYRPEVYARSDDNTGEHKEIVVRRGADNGGLCGAQLDQYINELLVTKDAVQAMEHLFVKEWAKTKAQVDAFDGERKRMLERRRMVTLHHDLFQVLLPDTETGNPLITATWTEFANSCGPADSLWNWSKVFSWAGFNLGNDTAMVRGNHSPSFCSKVNVDLRSDHIGFRPVMLPLNNKTGEYDAYRLSLFNNGDLIRFGTLYMDDEPVPVRQAGGELPVCYRIGAKLDFRCDESNQAYWIPWIYFNGKLMAAANLLCGISWNDLYQQGFAIG